MRVKWLLFVPPAVFGLLAGLFFAGMFRADRDTLPSTLVGRAPPSLALTAVGDTPLLTDAMLSSGGVTIVNFWASWCAPCRVEHPILTELAAEGVTLLGVNYKDDPANALGFLAELGNPYAALGADANGRAGLSWGLYGVPETFVLDRNGRVVLRFPGPVTRSILDSTIRPALAKAAQQ